MELNYSNIAEIVDSEIKDKALKKLIFKSSRVDEDNILGIDVLYRMMVFSFTFTLAKYKYDMQHGGVNNKLPNATRVFESYACIYNGEDVGLDLIIYLLTEMQLDVNNNDKKSYFCHIFSGSHDSIQIPALRSVIKTWLHSVKLAEKDHAKLLSYFVGLYKALAVLRNVEVIVKDDVHYEFKYLPTGDVIPDYNLIRLDKEDNSLSYLASYEIVVNNQARLSYVSLDGGEITTVDMPLRDFLSTSYITNNGHTPQNLFAKTLFSISFKYVKNLSLAVSDIITKTTKKKIYEHYSKKHNEVFEQLGYRNLEDIKWDNVITILMFEDGPSELLEFLLDSDGIYFEKLIQNLEVRYNEPGFAARVRDNYEVAQDEQMNLVRKYIDDNTSMIKNIIDINKMIMAKSIIDGLAEIENNKKHNNSLFVESLPMRIKNIDKLSASNETIDSKIIKINKALEKTFRYVIPFYHGLIAYHTYKQTAIADFEKKNEHANTSMSDDEKLLIIRKCEEKFYDVARVKSEETGRMSLGKLVAEFRSFAESLATSKAHKTVITQKGKIIKDALGRSYLCSLKTFDDIINMKEDISGDISDTNKSIISVINSVKHSKPGSAPVDMLLFKRFLLNVKKLMYFLVYNEDYEREMMIGQQISYDPIYPYVVRYTERSENRDGYDINSFSVFFSEDSGDRSVKILSENIYEINEKYYCIPNVTTSNSRWWIEPFLISCRKYDDIINSNDAEANKPSNVVAEEE